MKFRQHIPNWADGLEPEEYTVNTLEELLESPKVVNWRKDWVETDSRGTKSYPFFRYSISPLFYSQFYQGKKKWHLMAEWDEGAHWWVIGTIDEKVDLPEWKPNYERREAHGL